MGPVKSRFHGRDKKDRPARKDDENQSHKPTSAPSSQANHTTTSATNRVRQEPALANTTSTLSTPRSIDPPDSTTSRSIDPPEPITSRGGGGGGGGGVAAPQVTLSRGI